MKVIALGSSLGDGEAVFAVAERLLQLCGVIILQKSGNHKTKPFGGVAKNDFTNAVWQIETSYSPLALLNLLLSIENSCGRTRDKKWEDRTLDLDLLVYENIKMESKKLSLPHSEIAKRDFVLKPWAEIIEKGKNVNNVGDIYELLANLTKKNLKSKAKKP